MPAGSGTGWTPPPATRVAAVAGRAGRRGTASSAALSGRQGQASSPGRAAVRGPALRGPDLRGPCLRGPALRGPATSGGVGTVHREPAATAAAAMPAELPRAAASRAEQAVRAEATGRTCPAEPVAPGQHDPAEAPRRASPAEPVGPENRDLAARDPAEPVGHAGRVDLAEQVEPAASSLRVARSVAPRSARAPGPCRSPRAPTDRGGGEAAAPAEGDPDSSRPHETSPTGHRHAAPVASMPSSTAATPADSGRRHRRRTAAEGSGGRPTDPDPVGEVD